MRFIKSTVLLLAAYAFLSCNAASSDEFSNRRIIFNRASFPVKEWTHAGPAHAQQMVKFNIALQQRNLHVLEDLFWSVADPNSPKYGEFMEIEEIMDIIEPARDKHDQVIEWIKAYGVDEKHIQSVRDAVWIKVPVSVAEAMFDTKFHNFVNSQGRLITRQMGTYSVPEEVAEHIQLIGGISEFPMSRPRVKGAKELDAPELTDFYTVPQTLQAVYNYAGLVANTKVSQGVAEFQDDASYSSSDLAAFYKQSSITTTPISHIVGPFSGTYPDTEATLDIQFLTAVGINATNWYWTEDNWMYEFANTFFNTKSVPDVISMSWGWSETAQCDIDSDCSTLGVDSQAYVNRTNVEFQKIGLRGVTLLASSGDSGANGRTDGGCTDTQLHANFPAGSPYITSVGATELSNPKFSLKNTPPVCASYSCASGGTEVAVSYDLSGFTSGGGFSAYSAQPSYQATAVAGYLKSAVALPPSSYFTSTGRGYPDIAALGHNFLVYIDGSFEAVGGTSASSPTIGGIVSLINAARVASGQKKLGFANPWLYQLWASHPAAFNDVVSGDNICTEDGCASTCKGFKAYKGWDPVTGLGTPNVKEIITYVKSQGKSLA
eukprot:TRINITY_DN3_c0_g1_i1.p1 TRINITY_DN3_c0_g1~~TRINITY_DN3_c0_g1_i1.p1  ORF type:complete len:604 (+),score=202.53 TRINITY_DN3_c0_g1_i1:38-1849(+)